MSKWHDDDASSGIGQMPTKQEIEAELNASERDKAVAKIQEAVRDYEEFETKLRAKEVEIWQPHWSYNDPLPQRLRRTGVSEEIVEQLNVWFDGMSALHSGKLLSPEFEIQLAHGDAIERTSACLGSEAIAKAKSRG